MLIIRQGTFSRLQLERIVGKAGNFGIWEYHVSANSDMFPGHAAGRHAAISPAEPKEGQAVEAFVMLRSNSPQDEWRPAGKGVAEYR